VVIHDRLQRGRFRASRRPSFAAIGLLVVISITVGLAVWDPREEGVRGYVDGLAHIVSSHPLHDFPFVVTVSAAEEAVLANWGCQSLLMALGMVCMAIGFGLLCRALVARSRSLERSEATLRDSEASAPNQTDGTGQRSSLSKIASADWVQTKGLGLALCSAR
jgi:hypothetical protein